MYIKIYLCDEKNVSAGLGLVVREKNPRDKNRF